MVDSVSLAQRIEIERGDRPYAEVKELVAGSCNSKCVEGLTEDYTSLEVLNLAGVGLENISGLPKLPCLKKLILSNNRLSNGFEAICCCPNLEELDLSDNLIESLDCLTPLSKLTALRVLKLSGCELANRKGYRESVLSTIPGLKLLDEQENKTKKQELHNGETDDDDGEGDEEDVSDDDDEEEYGLAALQRSDELEDDDDEEDYAPGEEAEFDEYEDLDDEDEDDLEDNGANLSGADVSGPRRPGSKRRRQDVGEADVGDEAEGDVPAVKHRPTEEEVDNHVGNGTTVDN